MCSVEIDELGRELRSRRAAAGRTIASVAADAGLSVPYIANLENGRGNPTLAALAALSRALGAELTIELGEGGGEGGGKSGGRSQERGDARSDTPMPPSLIAFARTPRFATEAAALETAGTPGARRRLLTALAAMAAVSPRPLTDLDWHRLLDATVLISRPS
jgi:transcriptional regulator with XRE-family HTH domain